MNTFLQTQIKQRLEKNNLSIRGLEKKAGLSQNAVLNILAGRSKNPRTKVLSAIASIFGCSINDLLGEDSESLSSSSEHKKPYPWNLNLYIQTCQVVDDYINKNNLMIPTEKIIKIVWEIYTFSLSQNPSTIDPKFCEWFFNRD